MSVSEIERLPGVEEKYPVKIDLVFQRQNPQAQEGCDQPCSRCRLENLHQAPGVIAVGVGQIDPPQVSGLDLRPERLTEICPGGREATVDEQRLLGSARLPKVSSRATPSPSRTELRGSSWWSMPAASRCSARPT